MRSSDKTLIRSVVREMIFKSYRESLHEGGMLDTTFDRSSKGTRDLLRSGIQLTEDQALEILQTELDLIGLIPGPGDAADLVNASIYALRGKYILAAFSLMCIIPAVGTALGYVKLTTKKIPAAAASIIVENAGKIRELTTALAPKISNGDKISESVEKILSKMDIYKGVDIGLEVFETAAETVSKTEKAAEVVSATADLWYKAPGIKGRIADIARPLLTRVLARVTEDEFRRRLIKSLAKKASKGLSNIESAAGVVSKEDIGAAVIEHNDAVVRQVLQRLPSIVEDIASSAVIRIIDDAAVADKLAPTKTVLGHAFDHGEKVYIDIFLPRLDFAGGSLESAREVIENILVHEIRHLVDKRLGQMFADFTGGDFLTDAVGLHELLKVISDSMQLTKKELENFIHPSEMWVRVESLRDFLVKSGKSPGSPITTHDLEDFVIAGDKSLDSIPVDLKPFYIGLYNVFDTATLQKIADAMNKVL